MMSKGMLKLDIIFNLINPMGLVIHFLETSKFEEEEEKKKKEGLINHCKFFNELIFGHRKVVFYLCRDDLEGNFQH